MPDKSLTASILWDRLGIGVSGICAIHCLFFPVLISILPLSSLMPLLHEWAHPFFIATLVPIVYYAARRSHFDTKITTLLIVGFLVVLAGWLLGHFWLGFAFETGATLTGSFILIAGHWMNYRHHQECTNHNHQHHPEIETDSETAE